MPLPKTKIIEVQEGLPGANVWKILGIANDITRGIFDTPSGGGVEYTDHFGRNHKKNGQLEVVDTVQTGQPEPFTFNVELPFDDLSWLAQMEGTKSLQVRYFTGDYSIGTNYQRIARYIQSLNTSNAFTQALVNDAENIGDPQRIQLGQRASYKVFLDPVALFRLTSGVAIAINQVIPYGYKRSAGDVAGENTNYSGDEEFLFAADRASAGTPPSIGFTRDKGATITWRTVTAINDLDLTGIAKAGPNVVVCGPAAAVGGVLYVPLADLINGTYTITRSSGIAAGTAITRVIAVTSTRVIAVGNAGIAYISNDSGATFTSLGTAVTANNLTELAFADENFIWAGGASGTLVKIQDGVMSLVTVTGISTDAITSLCVPNGRGTELLVGSAGGDIFKTPNALTTATPTWTEPDFVGKNTGAVDDIQSVGPLGHIIYALIANGSSQSRVIRDLSGGYFGVNAEYVSTFTAPANSLINSIAPSSENHALVAGEANGGSGFVGRVA